MAEQNTSCDELDFKVVKYKKRRERRKNIVPDTLLQQLSITDKEETVDIDRVKRRIAQCREELIGTNFYQNFVDTLEKALRCSSRLAIPEESFQPGPKKEEGAEDIWRDMDMLVYGLGNFVTCHIARYQLALMLALWTERAVSCERCYVYDPQFTCWEKQILTDLGCSLIPQNEEGKRPCGRHTLVFMPHCGKALFNNLLWANWSPDALANLVIIGNSFSHIVDSVPVQRLHVYSYVLKSYRLIQENPVNNSFVHKDIFNDMSIHWFPLSSLQQAPRELWQAAPEPIYDCEDLEIIPAF